MTPPVMAQMGTAISREMPSKLLAMTNPAVAPKMAPMME
jgi:hypothetical protein